MKKAISLFSGCGGDTLGLERAGYTVVAFNEFKRAAHDTHIVNFPESVLIKGDKGVTDITKIPDTAFMPYKGADVVFAGFPCFVKDTLVLTQEGYKEIQNVSLEDKLLTHVGKFQSIVNLQHKEYTGQLYSVDIKYHPNNIEATEEHPFYVRRKVETWNNATRSYERTFGPPEWKHAKELTKDDYCGMAVNTKSIVPTITIQKKVNNSRMDTLNMVLDNHDEWFMMGYFVGDGWIQETKKQDGRSANIIRFAVHNNDHEVLARLQKVLPITDKRSYSGKSTKFGCANASWFHILKQFGKYAHGKKIPEWVQDAPTQFIQSFLEGYMAADGNIRKDGTYNYTTVSYDLAFGVQRLYLKLGRIFGIQKTKRPSTCVIQGRTVNQRDTYNMRGYVEERERIYSSFIEDGYAWLAIFAITSRPVVEEPVYNFEVDIDNSYIVENTIVHNCQGFSAAGKKKITDPRNQMFRQFVRFTKVVQPAFVIGENVPGLLSMRSGPSENDPLVIEQIRSAFAEIGYTLTYQVLEANEFGVPQKRKRLLIVGWRGELDTASFWASVSAWGATQTAPKLRSFVRATLEGALELLPAAIPEDFITVALPIPEDAEPSGTPHPFIVLKANSFGEVYNGKTMNRLLSCGKRDSPIHSEILDLDRDCKTIICTYDHQPRLLVGLRKPSGKSYVRCLLPEELKQIQGFPASFEITGTPKEKVVQIGNAVPPALVEAVARHLVSSASSLPKKRKIQRQAPQTTGADAATHPPETPL